MAAHHLNCPCSTGRKDLHWRVRRGNQPNMRLTQRAVVLAAVVAAVAAPVATGAGAAAGTRAHQTFINWPAYQNGPTHRSDNSAATAITPATVPALTRVWTWKPAN